MIHSHLIPAGAGIIQPMIELARCSKWQRIIVAGSKSGELRLELHRRGFVRVATTASCGLPAGQYDVALVDWRQRSVKALETTLDWLMDFLSPTGVLVVWVDPQQPASNRKLRSAIEKRDLVVEAGTVREHGSAIAAQRRETKPTVKVA
jgi:acetolactate synthase regulatory subunit